jgi:hypothetical protein
MIDQLGGLGRPLDGGGGDGRRWRESRHAEEGQAARGGGRHAGRVPEVEVNG